MVWQGDRADFEWSPVEGGAEQLWSATTEARANTKYVCTWT